MRSCPIRPQSFRSWHIQVQNFETNRMRCVSSLGDASFPRYLRFISAHARQLRIANLRMRRRKRRYPWNEASPRDETHLVRFVSTSCTLIRELQKDWARIEQLSMRRIKRRYLVEISTNLCAHDGFWFNSSRRIEWYVSRSRATFRSRYSFRACALRRNTYHSIRLDELNKNTSTAHRLVKICSRYRSFSTAHAQLPNSTPIFSELAYSGAELREESNEMCLVAGRRFVPEISSFYFCACAGTANCEPAHAQTKTPISLEPSVAQRRDTSRSIRLDELHLNPRTPKRLGSNWATAHAQK